MAWKILIIGLIILAFYFVYLCYLLFKSVKSLFQAGGTFAQIFNTVKHEKLSPYVSVKNIYENPARRETAQQTHQQIKEIRNLKRQKRLQIASMRWRKNAVANFQNIDSEARRKAKLKRFKLKSKTSLKN